MENKFPPEKLLKSKYRKEMWKNVEGIVKKIEKVLPISEMHLGGSFSSKKSRSADIDFIVTLVVPEKDKNKNWSVDLVIAPDNKQGRKLLEDNNKWIQQKYGKNKSGIVRYR